MDRIVVRFEQEMEAERKYPQDVPRVPEVRCVNRQDRVAICCLGLQW